MRIRDSLRLKHDCRFLSPLFVSVGALALPLLWLVVPVAWVSFFQINRTSLAWGDAFTFMLPVGHA